MSSDSVRAMLLEAERLYREGFRTADGMTMEENIALYEAMLKVAWIELELQKARGSLEQAKQRRSLEAKEDTVGVGTHP